MDLIKNLKSRKNRKTFKGEGHRLTDEPKKQSNNPTSETQTNPTVTESAPNKIEFLYKCPAVCDESYNYDLITSKIRDFVEKTYKNDIFTQQVVDTILQIRNCSLFLNTLSQILTNLIKDPDNEKFRSLRMTNKMVQRGIGDFPHGFSVLETIGFTCNSETQVLTINPPLELTEISKFLESLNSSVDLFTPKLDPDIIVYKPTFKYSISDEVVHVTAGDIMARQVDLQKKVEKMETLVSTKYWEKDKPFYRHSRLRLIMPDEWRFECSFESSVCVREIVDFLVENMNEECGRDFFFMMGNRRIGDDSFDKSILEMDLGQTVSLRLRFNLDRLKEFGSNFQYLKSSTISRFLKASN